MPGKMLCAACIDAYASEPDRSQLRFDEFERWSLRIDYDGEIKE